MKRNNLRYFSIILLFVPLLVFGQKSGTESLYPEIDNKKSQTFFPTGVKLVPDNNHVVDYLIKRLGFTSEHEINSLEYIEMIESPGGYHFVYIQSHYGVPLYGSQIKVNLDKKGNVRSLIDNSYRINTKLDFRFPEKLITDVYLNRVKLLDSLKWENVFFKNKEKFEPAVQLVIFESDHSYYEVVLDCRGEQLYYQDLNRYFQTQDSTVIAKVFLPDPLTTAEVVYGAPYVDGGDDDIPELNAELVDVFITVDYTTDTFFLKGPWVEIREFSNPLIPPAYSLTPDFNYTRADNGFEDVNCYYHLHEYQLYIQSLGFMNICNYSIGVDAHALNGADNSMYQTNKLYFGEGCVDDAEDADVIIHEYGHAIASSAAPGTWVGTERKALEEGLGDYFAVSYGRAINSFNWADMFSWDGHNLPDCWAGRTAATTKTYPDNMGNGIHADGEIWSSTIMQIWETLGQNTTDQIMLQSLYSYASNITYTDAAYMFLDADSMLNAGANYYAIYYWFQERGILPALTSLASFNAVQDAACGDSCNATAMARGFGGIEPYTYAWKDTLGASIGINIDSASGLCVGQRYVVTVTDSVGSVVIDTTDFIGYSTDSLAVSIVTSPDSGSGEGTARVKTGGTGTPTYNYIWDDPSSQTSALAVNLGSGNYTVTVTDALGCEAVGATSVALLVSNGELLHSTKHIRIYPNPTSGDIFIELNQTSKLNSVEVYNILGEQMTGLHVMNNALNVGILRDGYYLIIIKLDSGVIFKRPIVLISD